MNFYLNEVNRLNNKLYPHDDLTKKVILAKSYIDKHFPDNIGLDEIAGKVHVSKFHFIRIFKKYYGVTPHQYLQETRIEKAKQLLQKGKSIDAACDAVGFSSKTSFIGLFKKITGKTPLAFQKQKEQF